MRIVPCTVDRHAAAVLAIFNDAILHSTALYEDDPRTMDVIRAWFDAKARGGFPIVAAEADDGTLLGFATYGTFRDRPGYRFTVEHSEAGLYLWLTRGEDSWDTVAWLAERGILTAPGAFYGPDGARHVRAALTATDERIAEAAKRLAEA